MHIILLIALILLVIGVALLLAGHLAPSVPPGAVSAGWGLIILGVILLIVWLIVTEVEVSDGDGDRGLMLAFLVIPLWSLLARLRR